MAKRKFIKIDELAEGFSKQFTDSEKRKIAKESYMKGWCEAAEYLANVISHELVNDFVVRHYKLSKKKTSSKKSKDGCGK